VTRFICLKQGHKYGVEYVNILHNRMQHYLPSMTEFVCYTDTPTLEFDAGITLRELPSFTRTHGWWYKCYILGENNPGRNLYMDLDMLITGSCEVYEPGDADLTGLWNRIHLNSSVLAWHNSLPQIWQRFLDKKYGYLGAGGTVGDQEVINHCVDRSTLTLDYWPEKYTAWLDVASPRLARNWTGRQSTIVCKGPRNPHEHLDHPLVEQYWKKL